MAEIKRYQKSQVFNQPVGVVRATGAEAASRAWAGVATAGQRIFEMGYQEAKVQQKALGDNFAKMSVIGRDDEGNYEVVEVPATFSPVARQTAELGLQENYVKQFALDAANTGKVLYAKYKNNGDTAGFLNDWEAATSGQIKAVAQDPKLAKYAPVMQQMMDNVGKEHVASLHSIAYDLADRKAYQNDTALIKDAVANLTTVAATNQMVEVPNDGNLEPSYAPAGNILLDQTLEAIDRLGEKYVGRLEVGTIPSLKAEARKAFHSGQMGRIISNLGDIIPPSRDPRSNNNLLGDTMQVALTAFSRGNLDDIKDPSIRAALEAAGLSNQFFQQEGMGDILRDLATEWSNATGRQQEAWRATQDDYKHAFISNSVNQGIPVGSKDLGLFLERSYSVYNATDLAGRLPDLVKDPAARNAFLYNTVAPDVVKEFLSPDFAKTFLQQNPQAMPTALNFFRQATLAQNGTVRAARGIDVKTVQFWEELNAYAKSGQTMSMDQFLEAETALQEGGALVDSSIQNKIYEFTGKESKGVKAALEDFTLQAVGNDPDMAVFFGNQAKRLVYIHGADKAFQIIKSTKDKIFVQSDLMYEKDRKSLFAPEMFYQGAEMDVFRSTVATRLRTAENGAGLVLGKNVGLVADRRGTPPVGGMPTSLPTYTLRYTSGDKIGQPVRDANGPIEIGPQAIISARAEVLRMTEADWLKAWQQSYDMRFGATDQLGRVKKPPSGATFNYSTQFKTIDDAKKAAAEAGK